MAHVSGTSFVVDTDVWIGAQRKYAGDVFPGVWDALANAVQVTNLVRSPRQVVNELGKKDSGIRAWVEQLRGVKLQETAAIAKKAGDILTSYPDLPHGAAHDIGDLWVIAHAWERGHVVVTEEVRSRRSPTIRTIPDICDALSVEVINTVELLRRLGAKFR